MKKSTFVTPEDAAVAQKNLERWSEHLSYVMENPSELDKLDGATVVFDEESFQRMKSRANGGKVVLVTKTYNYSYA